MRWALLSSHPHQGVRACLLASLVFLFFLPAKATADIVQEDDVIIRGGSLCVGFDCSNGESFGFDSIRLKENNLRIHAQDTSESASFPSTDWRLVFNDDGNGGANYFAIQDATAGRTPFKVEGNAPTNSLYVDGSGRIGIGTGAPAVEVHTVDGDTPTLRLDQDGSSGFTPQIWDVAGNETNFFIRDTTNGSNLPFKIRPGAPDDMLVIESDPARVVLADAMIDGDLRVLGDVSVESDGRLKTDIQSIATALAQVRGLDGKTYRWSTDDRRADQGVKLGFIAQEVEAVLPELVTTAADGKKAVNYLGVIPLLVNALKEQMSISEKQSEQIKALSEEVQSQRALINDIHLSQDNESPDW